MAENILNWLDANWFALLVGVFLTGLMLYGHNCGFLRLSISIAAVLITAVLTRLAMPPVTAWIKEHTALESTLEGMIIKRLSANPAGNAGISTPEEQAVVIDSLSVPEGLRDWIKENNTEIVWEKLGVKEFTQYLADYLSRTIIHFILFALLFLLIWILLRLLMKVLDVFAKLPVIHGLNQIAGAVLGLGEGLFYLWIFFLVLSCFTETVWGRRLLELIYSNVWLRFLYQYNMITWFLKSTLGALL
ncbi:MAG: CvpA family protein [Stomatobaculum sp.]|nr:CvpA family protein [Stomatobaculum sp.]